MLPVNIFDSKRGQYVDNQGNPLGNNPDIFLPKPAANDPEQNIFPNVQNLKGFIEALSSAPNFVPKNFYDSIKIFSGALYIYNYETNTWFVVGGGSYLVSAGIGTALPSASTFSGQYYYLTTTDTLYRSNGTAWIALN